MEAFSSQKQHKDIIRSHQDSVTRTNTVHVQVHSHRLKQLQRVSLVAIDEARDVNLAVASPAMRHAPVQACYSSYCSMFKLQSSKTGAMRQNSRMFSSFRFMNASYFFAISVLLHCVPLQTFWKNGKDCKKYSNVMFRSLS